MSNESASAPLPPEPLATPPLTPEPQATVTSSQVNLRRAPKYSVFLVVGALVGALVTLIVTALFPVDPAIGFAALYGYFVLYGIPIGVVLGALVAFAFDRISSRRARQVTAELTTVEPLPDDSNPDDSNPDLPI